jgi:ATP-dependent protease Clp ATPase subunit
MQIPDIYIYLDSVIWIPEFAITKGDNCLQVLTEPRNALGKQYRKMFAMNQVSFVLRNLIAIC